MAKVNDIVRFMDATGGGRIVRIEGKMAYVVDQDGFEQPVLLRECVVVGEAGTRPAAFDRPAASPKAGPAAASPAPAPPPSKEERPAPLPVVETEEGEELNVVLAYEPRELKRLNATTYYAYLVNDSNYYLHASYMTRGDNADGLWRTRFHGLVEPNTQVLIDEVTHDDLPGMSRVAVQYAAFKDGKNFKLKNPALVEHHLDTTKFYKVHCFGNCEYFDTPVIALGIAVRDRPAREMVIDSGDLERAMRQKRDADRPRPQQAKSKPEKARQEIIECDLHINQLIDTTAGMTNTDIINCQLSRFRQVMDKNLRNPGARIVFIHGKGEGVLRKALLDELKRRYPQCEAQDASFREYGFGATLVRIHQRK